MEKIMQILVESEGFPELKDIKVGDTISVSLTENKINELNEELNSIRTFVNTNKTKKDYDIAYAGYFFKINKI